MALLPPLVELAPTLRRSIKGFPVYIAISVLTAVRVASYGVTHIANKCCRLSFVLFARVASELELSYQQDVGSKLYSNCYLKLPEAKAFLTSSCRP